MSPTPILDLEAALPAPRFPWAATIIGGLAAGVAMFAATTARPRLPNMNGILLIPALYVAIAAHELGHLLVARLVGMQPGGIAIGGFVFYKSGAHWVRRFDWRRMVSGGFAIPLSRTDEFRRARFAWMVAGGPLASILLSGASALFIVNRGNGAAEWAGTLFWASALTITSLLPISSGVNKSDGLRFWELLWHPKRSRAGIALLKIQTQDAQGVEPANWNANILRQAMEIDSAPEYSYCQLLACYRASDQGDEQGAAGYLENALAHSRRSGRLMRYCLSLEAACVSALVRHNAANARAWFECARKLRKPESGESVLGAIALCESRYQEAAQHFAKAIAFLDRRRLDSGLARFSKKKMGEYEKLCLEASQRSAVV